ncbi:MAG: ral secretion pathway protein [Verrucomicrobiaceae bacterium]|nr:ral secretion pathway protein [Verrucomicrobiaceae bacterium]
MKTHRISTRRHPAGFSLIEIVIAMTIVAILGATVIKLMSGNIDVAKEQAVQADIDGMSTQLMVYESRAGRAPTTEQGLKALWEKPTSEPVPERWVALLEEEKKDPWGQPYKYAYPATKSKKAFDIWSVGKDGQDGTADDIGNFKNTSTK